jgi:hypothetical protein
LHLFESVAVPQQLEVLPGRKERHEHQQDAHEHRLPQLPLSTVIDLAHNRVVPNVFLDGVLEAFHLR